MKDKFDQFFQANNGKFVEVEDSSALNQCLDLAFAWCEFITIPHSSIAHATASQVWTNPTDASLTYFEYIPNTANGVPQVGDLVVFGTVIGSAGHISISNGSGDINSFNSFDENWGNPKSCRIVNHTYAGVLGFVRPKNLGTSVPGNIPAPQITNSSKYNFGGDYGILEMQQVRSMLIAKDKSIEILGHEASELSIKLSDYENKPIPTPPDIPSKPKTLNFWERVKSFFS